MEVYSLIVDESSIEGLSDDIILLALQQYVYDGRVFGIKELTDKIKEKSKKIIFHSLKTTRFLLEVVVNTAISVSFPPIAKELSILGVNTIISMINKKIHSEKYKEVYEEDKQMWKDISADTKKVIEDLMNKVKDVYKTQSKKLKKKLKKMMDEDKQE